MSDDECSPAETLFFQGTQHMKDGDVTAAETCFRHAIQLAPDFAEAYANLGLLLENKNVREAEDYYRRSLSLNPSYSQTHLNLGALLANSKRFDEAEIAYLNAIALAPDSPVAWSNLGVLYACGKREDEAEQCYRTAISLDEEYRTARFNLSYVLLRQGRFEEGWDCLRYRNWQSGLSSHLACPPWQGESLAGKSILIGHEAGHGDMIQFCRYATVLKELGASSITMVCHPALKTLFASVEGVDCIMALDETIPSTGWDYWTPILDIPYFCKTRIDSIPANIPYLQAPADRIDKWAARLPQNGIRVGLVWKGNPLFEGDADRSLPSLDVLSPLATLTDVNFISLQKGAGEDEAMHPPAGMHLTHVGSQLSDFADTAAVVMNLDLVICTDTAMVHLAGALGKPCWVLLPYYRTDWRWLVDRSDSPWYPGIMRLFRQTVMADWNPVIAEILAALKEKIPHG